MPMVTTRLPFLSLASLLCLSLLGCASSAGDSETSSTTAAETSSPGYVCSVDDRTGQGEGESTSVRLRPGEDIHEVALANGTHSVQLDTYVGLVQAFLKQGKDTLVSAWAPEQGF